MTPLLKLYLEKLQHYRSLQISLHSVLESVITLKSVDSFGYKFFPTEGSILEHIRRWPEDAFPTPPAAWVEPRKGTIELNSETWEFAFHGAGLSFFHSQTGQDVSLEYSRQGDLGITESTFLAYLETLNPDEPYIHDLLEHHEHLFQELVQSGHLIEVPPLLPIDDRTFVPSSSLNLELKF